MSVAKPDSGNKANARMVDIAWFFGCNVWCVPLLMLRAMVLR